jgi:hypothetical protein
MPYDLIFAYKFLSIMKMNQCVLVLVIASIVQCTIPCYNFNCSLCVNDPNYCEECKAGFRLVAGFCVEYA